MIRLLPGERNLGIIPNFYRTLGSCNGKYIALCEGDDYWTDPNKLQKQVEFLETNPEYGLCYTSARVLHQTTNTFAKYIIGVPIESLEDLLLFNHIPTMTTVFRKAFWDGYSSEVLPYSTNWKMGDLPLWLYIATKSKLKFMEGITGAYRSLEESASHSKSIDHILDFALSGFEVRNFFADKYHVSDETRKRLSMKFYCDYLFLAFLVNKTDLVSQARLFFEANHFAVLRRFHSLFAVSRKNRFALRMVNYLMNRYRKYRYK
jgi:hypothetical protein